MARTIEVTFDEFGWGALTDEAKRQGVTIEELVAHAAMYYLADSDSERLSRRVLRGVGDSEPNASADEVRRQR
jgi:hypothetical protein